MQKTYIFLTTLFLLGAFSLSAQKVFNATIGKTGTDEGYRSIVTADGNFAMIGYSTNIGIGKKGLLSKFGTNGDLMWAKTLGYLVEERFYNMSATSDGGFIAAGEGKYCVNFNCGTDAFVMKLDANGTPQWMKGFGGIAWDGAWDVKELSNGDYIILGETVSYGQGSYDLFLIRTNSQGDTLWTRTYGSVGVMYGEDKAAKVEPTADGGFMVLGSFYFGDDTGSNNEYEPLCMKVNANGDVLWAKSYRSSGTINKGHGFCKIPGGYMVLTTYYLAKIDDSGNLLASRNLPNGFTAWGAQNIHSDICLSNDGNILVAGGYNGDGCLLKMNTNGDLIWAKTYGSGGINQYDYLASVEQAADGRIIAAGMSISLGDSATADNWFLATDANGEIAGCVTLQNPIQNSTSLTTENITPLTRRGFMIATVTGTAEDASLAKHVTHCQASYSVSAQNEVDIQYSIAPNPVTEELNIDFTTDIKLLAIECWAADGKKLKLDFMENGSNRSYQANLSTLPSGIYYLQIISDTGTLVHKIVKE